MGARACVSSRTGSWSSRDHGFSAKARSSDEMRTIFPKGHRAAPVEPVLGNGHPGRKLSSARWAGRSVGPGVPASGEGVFRAMDFGGSRILLLLFVDYNQAATAYHKGTKAQRTHEEMRGGPPALRSLRATARGPGHPGSSHSSPDGRSGGLTHGRACLRWLAAWGAGEDKKE
jgi:hypothetical protein